MPAMHVPVWAPRQRRDPAVLWLLAARRLVRPEVGWLVLGIFVGAAFARRRVTDQAPTVPATPTTSSADPATASAAASTAAP